MLHRQNWVVMFLVQSRGLQLGVSAGLSARGLWWADREWLEIRRGVACGKLITRPRVPLPHGLGISYWGNGLLCHRVFFCLVSTFPIRHCCCQLQCFSKGNTYDWQRIVCLSKISQTSFHLEAHKGRTNKAYRGVNILQIFINWDAILLSLSL
jgi:hypothetical protein